jgi:HTH-type transcriptional regulator / antitoxin HigA
MSETIRPARAVAPGRIILRELEAREWSQQDLAAIMSRPEQVISEIIRAKKQITAETALQLAKAFGTSPEFWLNLEMQYQLHQVVFENHETEIERRSKMYHLAPINEMTRRGWIHRCNTINEQEQEYCRFFQVPSIDSQPQVAFRPRVTSERGPQDRSIVAWVRRVEQLAEEQEIKPFSAEALPLFIENLLALANLEANIEKIPSLFIQYGLHFIIVPHLPKTYLDGASLWINDHPVVALSLRYDRIDAFWFTLLHEVAHIYRNHKQVIVDQLFDGEKQNMGQEEIEADELAAKWLLSEEALQVFIELYRPRYSRVNIEQFAAEHKRHPGIIVGQLMHRKELKYSHLREYLVKVRPILGKWEDVSSPNKG